MAFRVLQWCHPMLASSLRTSCCTRMITLYGDRNWIQARALTSCSNSHIWFSVQVSILRGAYTEWQRLIQVNGDAWEWVWDPFSSGTMHSNETLPLPFSLFTPLNGTVMVAILLFFRNGCHSRWPTKFSTTRSSGVRHNRGLSSGSASSYINRAPHDTIWPQKEGVCLEQNISIGSHCMAQGHFMLHFTTFHNVSIYVKWPQKLVIKLKIEVFSFRCKSPS